LEVLPRRWATTRENTHKLFKIARTESLNKSTNKATEFGIKDTINVKLLTMAKRDPMGQAKLDELSAESETNWRMYNPFLELLGEDLLFCFGVFLLARGQICF
jgi:hypothetical protein